MPDSETDNFVVALLTKVQNSSASDRQTMPEAMVRLMLSGGRSPGFWSGEIIPPFGEQNGDWTLVERFYSHEQASKWQTSPERQSLLDELSGKASGQSLVVLDEICKSDAAPGMVATAIATMVKPGMEEDYFDWERRIQTAQAKYVGYGGVYWQPPSPGFPHQWNTLLRFDSPENLASWFGSDERRSLIAEQENLVCHTRFQKMTTAFPGWVPFNAETGEQPPDWKTALLVLLGLYPIVLLEIRFLSPMLIHLNPAVSSFINLVGSVVFTTFGTMPRFIRIFSWWMFPRKDAPESVHARGLFIILLLFAAEIGLLWNLLPPQI